MAEITSMSSGPQGTASREEAFSEPSSHEFGEESAANSSQANGAEENVSRGTNGEGNGEGPPQSAAQRKQLSKYERTKKQRIEFNRQQELFRQERERFANERAAFEESKKPKRNYTLGDLKEFREQWKKEADDGLIPGREELVRKADAEIAAMEAEERASKQVVELPKYGTKEHTAMWHQAETELRSIDPEFMKAGSRVDTKLREIFAGPNAKAYRDHPQGIYAAYDRAQREILQEDNTSLRTENSQLQKELQRYTGLTSISPGVPGRMGTGGISSTADFARLSSADMRKHLLAQAKRNKDTTGWL